MIALLFDIDGTLLYAPGTGQKAFVKAFTEQFGPISLQDFPDTHGKTDPAIADEFALLQLGRTLTDQELTRLNNRYTDLFDLEIGQAESFEVLPGVANLIPALAQRQDVLLGLQTGNLTRPAYSKLARAGVDMHFSFGGFACDSRLRPELVATAIKRAEAKAAEAGTRLSSVVVIGDTVADHAAAVACNAQFIGVMTGKKSPALRDFVPADRLLTDLSKVAQFNSLVFGRSRRHEGHKA